MVAKRKDQTLAERLSEARQLAKVLAKASDDLNEKLATVEKELVELELGVSATVDLPADFDGWKLAFRKTGDQWGLFFVHDGKAPSLIQTSSRAFRLAAVEVLKSLIDSLLLRTQEQVTEVDAGLKKLDALISELQDIPF